MSEIWCQSWCFAFSHHRDIEGTGEAGEDVLASSSVRAEEVGDRLGGDDGRKEGSDV
jgi:hypothetical protein